MSHITVPQDGHILDPRNGQLSSAWRHFFVAVARQVYRSGGTDVSVADGGTGASTATAGFDNLAPTTTKGDIIVHNGTDNIRVALGSNDQVLTADSAQASGVKWAAAAGGSSAAKFWVKATANSTTILASYNVTSWADTATGQATGTIATDFSSDDWAGSVSTLNANGITNTNGAFSDFGTQAAGTFRVDHGEIPDGAGAAISLADPDAWMVIGFGDQA